MQASQALTEICTEAAWDPNSALPCEPAYVDLSAQASSCHVIALASSTLHMAVMDDHTLFCGCPLIELPQNDADRDTLLRQAATMLVSIFTQDQAVLCLHGSWLCLERMINTEIQESCSTTVASFLDNVDFFKEHLSTAGSSNTPSSSTYESNPLMSDSLRMFMGIAP